MHSVILVHGLGRRASSLGKVARMLGRAGYRVTNWSYRSTRQSLTDAAQQLHATYASIAPTTQRISFVTHSMGGIVLRRLLTLESLPQLSTIAMLAPPNNGSIVAQRLLGNPLLNAVLGPAARELCDQAHIAATCALPAVPTLVIAGTSARPAQPDLAAECALSC